MNQKSTARFELKIGEAISSAMEMPIPVLLHNAHYGSSNLSLSIAASSLSKSPSPFWAPPLLTWPSLHSRRVEASRGSFCE